MRKFVRVGSILATATLMLLLFTATGADFRSYDARRVVKVSISDDPLLSVRCVHHGVVVTNNYDHPMRVWMEGEGHGRGTSALFELESGESVTFHHARNARIYGAFEGGSVVVNVTCGCGCGVLNQTKRRSE